MLWMARLLILWSPRFKVASPFLSRMAKLTWLDARHDVEQLPANGIIKPNVRGRTPTLQGTTTRG